MKTKRTPGQQFRFAGFTLDTRRCTLVHAGVDIALRPKSYEVLRYLIEHQGRPVPIEELLNELWSDIIVVEDSVRQCIIEIRKALGESGQDIIRTVPRRGYLFNVPVGNESDLDHPGQNGGPLKRLSPRWFLAGLAIALLFVLWWHGRETESISGENHTIAVLRFVDMSAEGDLAYLADGLSEEIIHTLAQAQSLRVIARTSSFAVTEDPIDLIQKRLGASHVLEGSIGRRNDEIRVTAQLIDATNSVHIWSRSYSQNMDQFFDIQRKITAEVADTLQISLADSVASLEIDPRAYELFLEARHFYLRRADGDLTLAQQRYEKALSISPEFARAWTGLAAVINARLRDFNAPRNISENREQLQELHRQAIEQAVRYGPELPGAHHRAAVYHFYNGEKDLALKHLKIARSIDPDNWLVQTSLADELRKLGRINESVEITRRGIQRDPLNMVLRGNLVQQLLWAGRIEEARSELNTIFELMPPAKENSQYLSSRLVHVQILSGDIESATNTLSTMPESPDRSQMRVLVNDASGYVTEAENEFRMFTESAKSVSNMLQVAEIYAYRGDSAKALQWLKRLNFGNECESNALAQATYYSPFLASLEEDPGWTDYRSGVLEAMHKCLVGWFKHPD